jgi:transcriptional regulator with XRE-family HTH domain
MGRPPKPHPEERVIVENVRVNLKRFREERGLKQEDVAKILEISVDNLRRYEQGSRQPGIGILQRLVTIYGHSTNDFFVENPPKYDPKLIRAYTLMRTPNLEIPPEIDEEADRLIESLNRRVREHDEHIEKRRPRPRNKKS